MAEQKRLAGPHCDLPKIEIGLWAFKQPADVIARADGRAAGSDQKIAACGRSDAGAQGFRIVARHAQIDRFAPEPPNQRFERDGIGTDDLKLIGRIAGKRDLIARREHGDSRLSPHG